MEDPLALENRRRIYRLISDRPGTHIREMQRQLDMQTGLLSYHLDQMERRGLIRSESDGYRRRYFPSEGYLMADRRTISLLRQDSPRRILMHLLVNGETTFSELREEMEVSKSTLSYHLKKLVKAGVIDSGRREREKLYWVESPQRVGDLLVSIGESIEEDAVDRFADIWEKMGKG
ncbi:MAG: winged helix-turn-helix transcriptional regulator [Methanomassiliicoccales archaeon]